MAKQWTRQEIQELGSGYREASVLAAAVDLGVFDAMAPGPMTADQAAEATDCDARATAMLLDALVAIGLLEKRGDGYSVPADVADLLTEDGADSFVPMARHHGNCLRRWARLPWSVRSGKPAEECGSIRGPEADQAAFIGGMHNISGPTADDLVARLSPLRFDHLLDVGGASGTWTIALLRAAPAAKATIFDLPQVIPMAHDHIAEVGMTDRVSFAAGDFYTDDLPGGCDLAWLGAIVHQNSRAQNRELFGKIHAALTHGGSLLIRDVIMDETRTHPPAGALFAINMLVATAEGGTFTFDELRADLESAGFADAELLQQSEFMDSVVRARKA